MNTEEQFLTPTSQVDLNNFAFSPSFEKQQNWEQFFNENHIGLGGPPHGSILPLHSLLSPGSPKTHSSVMNGDLDQAFASLLPDCPPAQSIQSYPIPTTTTTTSTTTNLFELQHLFSPVCTSTTAKTFTCAPAAAPTPIKIDKKPPPLKIPVVKKDLAKPEAVVSKAASPKASSDRSWQTVFVDPSYTGKVSISVTSKTRCEEPSNEIPSKLYSSLKYEIRQSAIGSVCSEVPFLLGRITVVDSVDFHEIQKEKKTVLKGVVEGSLVKPPTCVGEAKLEGTLKCQFTDVSYHHKKRGFCFQISYYTPNDLERPILITRSASFLVYARKPSQGKKRKHKETKEAPTDNSFDLFSSRLEELVQVSKKLRPTELKSAFEMVSSKLLQLDPAYFCEQLRNMQSQK